MKKKKKRIPRFIDFSELDHPIISNNKNSATPAILWAIYSTH